MRKTTEYREKEICRRKCGWQVSDADGRK